MSKSEKYSLLENSIIRLRALERHDLDFLYAIENNTDNWLVSSTLTPFSRELLENYLNHAHEDIFIAKQLRLAIIDKMRQDKVVGLIDIFDFDPLNKRAGIGIIIIPDQRNKGYGFNAIEIVKVYVKQILQLHQLYANILEDNFASIKLFEKCGFTVSGNKKQWIKTPFNNWMNEYFYQHIL